MTKTPIFTVVLLVLIAASTPSVWSQTAEQHLRQGDEHFAKFDNQKALEEYLLAVKADSTNYEALWKTARAYIDVGDLINPKEKDYKEKQKEKYQQAEIHARKAVKVNPNDTWGHFYLSAASGKYALLLGKKEQVERSKAIKAEIEKAIELDPKNDYAYHALGRWHRRMAEIGGVKRFFGGILYGGIPKGTFEESEKYLKKAIELNPNYVNHHLELGRTYMALEKYGLAAQEFQKCLELPVTTSKDHMYKEEARAELEKAKKKAS